MAHMRPTQKNRSGRSKGGRKPIGNVVNRVFESAGPEGKVRGTPQQIIDKYLLLARDAQTSSDRVAAENFLQHAEHYMRMLTAAQEQNDERRQQTGGPGREDHGREDQSRDDADDGYEDASEARGRDERSHEERGRPDRGESPRHRDGEQRADQGARDSQRRNAEHNPDQNADRRDVRNDGPGEGRGRVTRNGAGGLETIDAEDAGAPALVSTPEGRTPTQSAPGGADAASVDADAQGQTANGAEPEDKPAPRRAAPRRRARRAPATEAGDDQAREDKSGVEPRASTDETASIE